MSRTATEMGNPAEPVGPEADQPPPADGPGAAPGTAASVSAAYGTMVHLVSVVGAFATLMAAAGRLTMSRSLSAPSTEANEVVPA
ncbi:hypothetical protein [Streptomyces sp. NPDC002209]|uniref:hypothetical protein n=1 Tax=Streptomyces sp. NPDC002209 TaxID=3364638 RepID=UPI00368B65D9